MAITAVALTTIVTCSASNEYGHVVTDRFGFSMPLEAYAYDQITYTLSEISRWMLPMSVMLYGAAGQRSSYRRHSQGRPSVLRRQKFAPQFRLYTPVPSLYTQSVAPSRVPGKPVCVHHVRKLPGIEPLPCRAPCFKHEDKLQMRVSSRSLRIRGSSRKRTC